MPVRSFRIQDLLDYKQREEEEEEEDDEEEDDDDEDDEEGVDVEDSLPPRPIAKNIFVDLQTVSHYWNKDKHIRQSEDKCQVNFPVPLPIYIRNDHKFPSSWPPKRRIRTVFTGVQIGNLEKRFQSQHYLTAGERTELARTLKLTALQVKTWFQNRRMKWKKTCQ